MSSGDPGQPEPVESDAWAIMTKAELAQLAEVTPEKVRRWARRRWSGPLGTF